MILQFQRRWTGCNHHSHDNLQQDLADRRMASPVDPVFSHHTSQERQPAAVPGLPGLISHPSKVVLKIILNRLKPQAEKVIAEEQAGFRASRSTTEQIFNLRILCEKYLQHLQDLYHVFIDFKKACDRVKKRLKGRFSIRQNKTGYEFSRKSSFLKLSTIQKQTNYIFFAVG